MAQSQIQQYSLEELRRALAPAGTPVDVNAIGTAARQGIDLASTLQSRQLEQQQRAQQLQQEIAALKDQKMKEQSTGEFVSTLPPEQQAAALINPKAATERILKPKVAPAAKESQTKPPSGFKYTLEGNLEPIPGGPAELKQKQLAQASKTAETKLKTESDSAIRTIDDAIAKTSNLTAGVGSLASKIPGSSAKDYAAIIQTIKSRVGLQALLEAKATSPTGASGFGQLSDKELEVLSSQIANLDRSQSPEQLKKNLGEIKRHYQNALSLINGKDPYSTSNPVPSAAGAASQSRQIGKFTVIKE